MLLIRSNYLLLSGVSAGNAEEDMHALAYAQDIEQNEHSAFARNLTQERRAVPSSLIPSSLTACRIHSTVKTAMSEAQEQDFGSLTSSEDEKDRAGESQVDVGKVRQASFLKIVQRMHAGYRLYFGGAVDLMEGIFSKSQIYAAHIQ